VFNQLPACPTFCKAALTGYFCCATLCELTGSPVLFQQLLATQQLQQYWEKGLGKTPRNFDI